MAHHHDSGPAFDVSVPNPARIYDCLLGGKDNFEADRQAAARLLKALPGSARACRDNRDFLQRAVRWLATDAGIAQFLDIGAGLPAMGSVHETAPGARVAYVDNDPVVLTHARALLVGGPLVTVAAGDLTDPKGILASPGIRRHLDFSTPVAVLLIAVAHFLTDDDDPPEVIRALMDAVPLGSYLALTHVTADHVHPHDSAAAQQVYAEASAPVTPRSRAEVTRLFDGLDLIDPGVTDIRRWHPEIPPARPSGHQPPSPAYLYGGIGKKP